MNKFEIHHRGSSTEGFIYFARHSRLDQLLSKSGFSNSNTRANFENFFVRIEDENAALPFLKQPSIRDIIEKLASQKNFRSLEFRPTFVRIQTGANAKDVEPLMNSLVAGLSYSENSLASDLLEAQKLRISKRFDLYSPAHWLVSLVGTLTCSIVFLLISIWMSAALIDPIQSVLTLLLVNFVFAIICSWLLRRQIAKLNLPARAFIIHAVSTILLISICGVGFEIYCNSTFDPSDSQEYSAPIIGKDSQLKIEIQPPGPRTPIKFDVNENQFDRIVVGQSREILELHRGLLLQPWFSRQRLEY